jgi:hypothetical protein
VAVALGVLVFVKVGVLVEEGVKVAVLEGEAVGLGVLVGVKATTLTILTDRSCMPE